MPIASSIVAASLIGAAASTGTGLVAAKMQSGANKRAADLSERGLQEQLQFERERDAEAKRQFDAVEARRAPFREAANGVLAQRAARLGVSVSPMQAPQYQPQAGSLGAMVQRPVSPQAAPRGQTLADIIDARNRMPR